MSFAEDSEVVVRNAVNFAKDADDLAGPATLAAVGVFLPCFVIVVLAAPHYRRLAGRSRIKTVVEGVTAGAVGAIAGAVVVLGRRSITEE